MASRLASRKKPRKPTSDNVHLSELAALAPVSPRRPAKFAIDCKSAVARYADAALAANTRRAYRSDLRHYLAWGGKVPADAHTLARYLSDHAPSLSPSTLLRRLASISCAHRPLGADPTKTILVRRVIQGIRRIHGRPLRQARAISPAQLRRIAARLGRSARDCRDLAIVLVGFFGAMRRSELTNINIDDVEMRNRSFIVTIRRSKTDRAGLGRQVVVVARQDSLCPLAALRGWLERLDEREGPVFRSVIGGTIREQRLSTEAISLIIKRCVQRIGENPRLFSGHSLRAGFATAAIQQGMPLPLIMHQTGHKNIQTLTRYVRQAPHTGAAMGSIR